MGVLNNEMFNHICPCVIVVVDGAIRIRRCRNVEKYIKNTFLNENDGSVPPQVDHEQILLKIQRKKYLNVKMHRSNL